MNISKTILNIANISNQADKKFILNVIPDNLKKFIDGSISGEMKFGVRTLELPPTCGNTVGTVDDLVTVFSSVLRLKGNAKKQYLQRTFMIFEEHTSEFIKRLVTGTLSIGLGAKLAGVNKFSCQLASDYNPKKHDDWSTYCVEEKIDGMRALIFIDTNGEISAFSRGGKPINTVNHIFEELRTVWLSSMKNVPVVFDGEIAADSFNDTIHYVKRKKSISNNAKFHIFDILYNTTFEDFDNDILPDTSLEIRKTILESRFKGFELKYIKLVEYQLISDINKVKEIGKHNIDNDKEGVVVKDLNGQYKKKRDTTWFKLKGLDSLDLYVIDYKMGTGRLSGKLGSLIVDNNGTSVNVGTGFSDHQREVFLNEIDDIIGRIIEVEFHQITPDGSLRHPRFVKFRDNLSKGVKE